MTRTEMQVEMTQDERMALQHAALVWARTLAERLHEGGMAPEEEATARQNIEALRSVRAKLLEAGPDGGDIFADLT